MHQNIIQNGLEFIRRHQNTLGGHDGGAATIPQPFTTELHQPTVFFSALLLRCLHAVPGSQAIRKDAVSFLLAQKSTAWTWNYWQRDHQTSRSPYPDDLDDTSNALIGLYYFDPKLVTGSVAASLAQNLIAAEKAPGGPYRTWLVPTPKIGWDDIDIAVNANVGQLLALQNITLPKLNTFVEECIFGDKLTSPYYVSDIPILYFLSSWYSGQGRDKLKTRVQRKLSEPQRHNALMLSLLITAGVHLGVNEHAVSSATRRLLELKLGDHWPAEAMYLDPAVDGKPYYAGSQALTTGFALEALSCNRAHVKQIHPDKTHNPKTVRSAVTFSKTLPRELSLQYQNQLKRMQLTDAEQQITAMADIAELAYSVKLPSAVKHHLNQASLNGWMAYTIYDDFLDDEGKAIQLSTANVALRQTVSHFQQALPAHPEFMQLVDSALNRVDEANTWEVLYARGAITEGKLTYSLPDFADYAQLAHKSYGHMLVVCAVALYAGHQVDSPAMNHQQKFFTHFLIARQLNDDAHDWKDDLQHGHLSAVVCMLLESVMSPVDLNQPSIQVTYWEETITKVSELITYHIQKSRYHLTLLHAPNGAVLERLLVPLERAAKQALTSRNQAHDFIKTYQSKQAL